VRGLNTIGSRYALVVLVFPIPLDALAETIEPNYAAALVMKSLECLATEPHGLRSVNRLAAISRVAMIPSTLRHQFELSMVPPIHPAQSWLLLNTTVSKKCFDRCDARLTVSALEGQACHRGLGTCWPQGTHGGV
jgi:hypothetical protein